MQVYGNLRGKLQIAKLTSRPTFVNVRRLMIDTGSEVTWIAAKTMQEAGVAVA